MATLVIGVVGRALLGPIGGILGTIVGGGVDRALFGGGGRREVGRVANLAVQSAAYGEPIPQLFGRMRVAGNLIWSSGIRESRANSGGGKRGPETTSYVYSASFAVLLAGRPIIAVGRVWADGRLLRDAEGRWLTPVTMRLHRGSEDQRADPLLAAAEGAGGTPAYRGRALAVFEDMPLGDYGNRIPNLAFEIIADATAVDLGQAAADLAGGLPVAGTFPRVAGLFAGRAGSRADAIAPLLSASGASLAGLRLAGPGLAALPLPIHDGDARPAGETPVPERRRRDGGPVPDTLELAFFDTARDYQPGLQRARRGAGMVVASEALAAAMTAEAGKTLAATMLARRHAGRLSMVLRLPWRHLSLRTGDRLHADGETWRIAERRFEAFVLSLTLIREQAPPPVLGADPGRALDFGDAPPGETILRVLDLPALPGELPTLPRLWLAGTGVSPGWRRAPVLASRDGGASYGEVAMLRGRAVIGTALGVLPSGSVTGWDRHATIDVELLADGWLEGRSPAAVLAGDNLALLGDELFQFAEAQALAPRRFRLRHLLRGRRGTEAAVASHASGERFVLLDPAVLASFDPTDDMLDAILLVTPAGAGDAGAPATPAMVGGRALQPLAPVHLRARRGDGMVRLRWIRRSRNGFAWPDFVDVPLGEAGECYRVRLFRDNVLKGEMMVGEPAAQLSDPGGTLMVEVAQMGATIGRRASLILA